VCPFEAEKPAVLWAQAFRISDGVYNVVGYVENRNKGIGANDVPYTFTLYDTEGRVITKAEGKTSLPPDSTYPIFEGRVMAGTAVPKRAELVLGDITTWEKMEHGREQFTVEKRVLKSADNAPRLDATLFNTELSDAKNVEVIATVFDSKHAPLTTSRTTIPLFLARQEKSVTFTWPEPIAGTMRSCEVPSDVVLAIDLSGSIDNDGGKPPEPLASVLKAASAFAGNLKTADQVSVVTFATKAETRAELGADVHEVSQAILGLHVDPKEQNGGTNIGDALVAAEVELSSVRHNPDARKVVVLITDGQANAPIATSAAPYAEYVSAELKKRGTNVYTIGLGKSVNANFLKLLATNQSTTFLAADRFALENIYHSISTSICEDGPAVIEIVPKAGSNMK
jgi:Mg-chelatase subunit ChlD